MENSLLIATLSGMTTEASTKGAVQVATVQVAIEVMIAEGSSNVHDVFR
jgi:hypothetical protein